MVCTSRSNTGSSPCVSCHKQHLCEQSTVARKLMEGNGLPAASLLGAMAKSNLMRMYTHTQDDTVMNSIRPADHTWGCRFAPEIALAMGSLAT